MGCPRAAREADGPSSEGLLSATIRSRDTPAKSAPFLSPSVSSLLDHVGCHANRSMRPRICRKRDPRQVAFGKLQSEVPGMPDEASAGLEDRCWRLVSDQLWMANGRVSRRSKLPRLYAITPRS